MMMKRSLLVVLVVAVALIVAAGSMSAQPKQGDVIFNVFGTGGGLYYLTWPSGTVRTLNGSLTLDCTKVPSGNGYVYASGGSSGNIYRFDNAGTPYTVTTVTTGVAAIGVDQDGSHMIANTPNNTLYRLSGTSCTAWLTLPTTYGKCNAICRDGNTGDWIVGMFGGSAGYLLRVDRLSKSYSVFSTVAGSPGIYGVDWIPQTGEYVVVYPYSSGSTMTRVSFMRTNGTIRASTNVTGRLMNAVTVDQKTGRVFAASNNGWIYEFTSSGSVKASKNVFPAGVNISGIDIWDDQNVSITQWGSGSSTYVRAQLQFNESPSRSYYVALSTAPYPGVNLGASGWVNLQPNSLFFVTVGGGLPYFTQAFSGVLSASGLAYARWVMPYGLSRVYVTAVAVNPSKPGGIDVGNVEVVDTW